MSPTDNRLVAFFALGEGFHNYHHTFPWDCKAAELGSYEFNWTTMFLDFFTWIGWAYDLKTVPDHIVRDRVRRTGDGSHSSHHHEIGPTHDIVKKEEVNSWGWGDIDIPEEHYKMAKIIQPSKAR
jgi:stearoyl-CoA desaturase (delta-9 desaturase)